MSKTVLRPSLSDLQTGDRHLKELHRYALHLVQRSDPDQVARNASLLYLTVVNAFKQAGLTELDWVPSLYIEVGLREYEIQVSDAAFKRRSSHDPSRMSVDPASPTAPRSAESRSILPSEIGLGKDSESARSDLQPERAEEGGSSASEASLVLREERLEEEKRAANEKTNKHLKNLIDGLIVRDFTVSTHQAPSRGQGQYQNAGLAFTPLASGEPSASMADLGINSRAGSALAILTPGIDFPAVRPLNINSVRPVDRIERCARELDCLEGKARSLSVKTNWAYWRLGKAYQAFCLLKQQKDKDWQSRTEQQRLFGLLCEETAFQSASVPGRDRSALQKRLQRARKFVFMAEALGTPVLDMAPEVSISRLDVIKLDDLQGLMTERGELQKGVEAVARKIRLAEAMCSNQNAQA